LHTIKEEIKALDAAKGVTRVSKQQPRVLEDVQKLLLVWINEKQLAGKTLGLEVNEADIQELVEEHEQELTTDELMDLHREQQQEIMEDISSEEEEKKTEESLTSNKIREFVKCGKQCKIL
jgi:TnpA family transposase